MLLLAALRSGSRRCFEVILLIRVFIRRRVCHELHGVKWKFQTGGEVISSPAVVGGVVYVGSNDGRLYAIDEATGALKWKFATGARDALLRLRLPDGVVFFGSYDGNFYAVDAATGKVRWKFKNARRATVCGDTYAWHAACGGDYARSV